MRKSIVSFVLCSAISFHMSAGGYSGLTVLNNPYRYSGYYHDPESGQDYCRSRYYMPDIMCFISRDTYNVHNRYSYCECDPVSRIDENGHISGKGALLTAVATAAAAAIVPILKRCCSVRFVEPERIDVPRFPSLPLSREEARYPAVFYEHSAFHYVDIDGTLLDKNPDNVTYSRSQASNYIPRRILESINVATFTYGHKIFGYGGEFMFRRSAISREFPSLCNRPCYSGYQLNGIKVPRQLNEDGALLIPSKWAYIASGSVGDISGKQCICLWDDAIEHITTSLHPETSRLMQGMPQDFYDIVVSDAEACCYRFDKSAGSFVRM